METEKFFNTKSNTKETNLEISTQNYKKATETLSVIIGQISSLPIPEKTIQDWKVLLSSIRIVDDKLDHIVGVEERLKFTHKIIAFLKKEGADFSNDRELEKAMLNVESLSINLNESQKEFFYNLLFSILEITEKAKVEENSKNFINLRRLEGQITAKLFLPFLPEEFKQSKEYPKLIHALTRLARAGNSFDSLIDLPTDHKNKQVQISPSILNRILFIGAILSDSLSILKDTKLSQNIIKELLLSVKNVAKNFSEKH